jgi:hypothetical protein
VRVVLRRQFVVVVLGLGVLLQPIIWLGFERGSSMGGLCLRVYLDRRAAWAAGAREVRAFSIF